MINESRQKVYISLVMLSVIIAMSAGAIWYVYTQQLAQEREVYIQNREHLNEIEQKTNLRQDLKKEFENIIDSADILADSLLDKNDTLVFIQNIEQIAQDTNNAYEVKMAQEIRGEGIDDKIKALALSIEMNGSFINALRFFRELKKLPYLMDITRLSMGNISEEGIIITNITLKVYVR